MKKYIFPYGFKLFLEGGKVNTFPAIDISLFKKNSNEEFSFLVLVDSGAEVSLFTKSDAELLGFSLGEGKKIDVGSISGDKFPAFLHPAVIKIGEEKLKVEVAFSEKNDTPRVLGRNPIFSYFFVIFDNKNKNTIFISRKSEDFEKSIYNKNSN